MRVKILKTGKVEERSTAYAARLIEQGKAVVDSVKSPAGARATASSGPPRGTLTARGEGGRISTDDGGRPAGRKNPRNSSDVKKE